MAGPNRDVLTIILAGGQGELSIISQKRAIASVPFGGKYRIIDFTLSNCVNSGLYNILVFTQYRPLSLHEHIGNGKPWDLDRLRGGIRIVSPYLGRQDQGWDRGTADAVYQNMTELVEQPSDNVLILGSDHIYKMDYRPMIDLHLDNNADVTVGVLEVPIEEAHRFGIVTMDSRGRVTAFDEKPAHPKSNLVSMGIYVFNKDTLIDRLVEDAHDNKSNHDFGRNVLPKMIEEGDRVFAYAFNGYWRDVGTVQSYWEANMDVLNEGAGLDMYGRGWTVYTRSEERPPAVVHSGAEVVGSLISHGCQVRGKVIHSVLSPGVVIEEGAEVRDSIVMVDSVVGKNAKLERAIIDKEVVIGADCEIGCGDDNTANRKDPELHTGLTLVGKRAILPDGLRVGRNAVISPDVKPEAFKKQEVPAGETV